tara:strand:- start:315 stop:674 length:360 start_codon:yes stop_codon:yes gene_type:complete
MAEHNDLGVIGEQYAVDYLLKNGYKIRYRNYRYLKAEIDIIAQKQNTVVILEVKTRSTDFIENLGELITPKKIKLLVMAANHYMIDNELDFEVRFDIIIINTAKRAFELNHIEDAFYHF